MYSQKVALALAPLFLLARADVQLDNEDVPSACSSICAPIVTLGNRCEVDLNGDNNDRIEDNLEAQCFCLNDSFDVANIAGLCAGCISANPSNSNDDDANDASQDISEVLYTCGWSSKSWSSAQTTAASGITVVATAPTASSQLTTTIVPGATATSKSSSATSTGSTTNSNSNTASNTDTSNGGTSTSTITSSSSSDENAAGSLAPFGVAGAAVAFAALLLA